VSDVEAQVGCDDDGDYVIVLSDAMLRLATHVARAADDKVEEYAAFLSRSQLPGRRLLPPPPGFYSGGKASSDDSMQDILAFVIGHELARLRAGDLVCPKPTATKERGDEIWSSAEQRRAAEVAMSVYPHSQAMRDDEALARLLDSGRSERGALAWLRFFAAARFKASYAAIHPDASVRLASAKRLVESRKAQPL
jgi:hypothetical protein